MKKIRPLEHVITAAEAAELYGLTKNTFPEAIKRGSLPARKSATNWLVDIEDLVRYKKGKIPYEEDIPLELKPAFIAARVRVMSS